MATLHTYDPGGGRCGRAAIRFMLTAFCLALWSMCSTRSSSRSAIVSGGVELVQGLIHEVEFSEQADSELYLAMSGRGYVWTEEGLKLEGDDGE